MIILLKHILKNIWENKFRSIIIILVVMLSTFVTFTALSLQDIVTDTYNKTFNGSVRQILLLLRVMIKNCIQKKILILMGLL